MGGFSLLSRGARLYFALIVSLGTIVPILGYLAHPLTFRVLPTLLYLGVGVQIAALMPIRWKNSSQQVHDPLLLAAGLFAPGAGVALLAWLALYDGRRPGRDISWWAVLFNRAMYAITYGLPSIALLYVHLDGVWALPVKTLLYAVAAISINYPLTARAVAFITRAPMVQTLRDNVGLVTVGSMLVLCFSGGILYELLQSPVGYLMAPGLFGFLVAVRGNVADAQRQAEARQQTLELAAQALDARDPYTESHSARVAQLAARLGETLKLGGKVCDQLKTAGTLHDLGKIGIRDHILNKAGPLTPAEWEEMKRHPDIGADMIRRHSALAPIAPWVRHHHERWDGSGYPMALNAGQIPFGARILAVADSFDTVTTARVYRSTAMTPRQAVEHISAKAGSWYDPAVVAALQTIYDLRPTHSYRDPAMSSGKLDSASLLRNSRFVTLLIASGISALGDPLTVVATLVSLYAVTRDPRIVALAYGLQACSTILMGVLLGGLADRVRRQMLLVWLESFRAVLLVCTPLILALSLWCIFPVLFVISGINALTQPARQAAIAEVVPGERLGRANAIMTGLATLASAVAFPTAGLIILVSHGTSSLFVIDGITFLVAAAFVLRLGNLGGGAGHRVVLGSALRIALSVRHVPTHLAVVACAALFLSMSFPALIALAYQLSTRGAQTFTWLEGALSVGVLLGSILVGRMRAIGTMRTVALGILVTGTFSLAMAAVPTVALVAAALLLASIGNPVYTVANQTALLRLASSSTRGSVMTSRFAVTQVSLIVGSGLGGVLTQVAGPRRTYGIIGFGLICVAAMALNIARRERNRYGAQPGMAEVAWRAEGTARTPSNPASY